MQLKPTLPLEDGCSQNELVKASDESKKALKDFVHSPKFQQSSIVEVVEPLSEKRCSPAAGVKRRLKSKLFSQRLEGSPVSQDRKVKLAIIPTPLISEERGTTLCSNY